MIDLITTAPTTGSILIAQPFMRDTHFKRSVVLLTEYEKEGILGYVLNKPTEFLLHDLLPDMEGLIPDFNPNVYMGGPVQLDTLQYIHTLGDKIEDANPIVGNIYMGGDFQSLLNLAKNGWLNDQNIKFFIGYSGWNFNQLNDEIDTNSWIIAKANADKILAKNAHNDFWKNSIADLGKNYKPMVNYPEDLAWN